MSKPALAAIEVNTPSKAILRTRAEVWAAIDALHECDEAPPRKPGRSDYKTPPGGWTSPAEDWGAPVAFGETALAYEFRVYDVRERARDLPIWRECQRAMAKAIIEGRRPWPRTALRWKREWEADFHAGERPCPPWLDPKNLTPPQRARLHAKGVH